jgi:hypothetical protein
VEGFAMPSGKHKSLEGLGEHFVRPLTDTIKDLELEYQVVITTTISTGARRSEIEVKMQAQELTRGPLGRPFAVVSQDWPHSTTQSLPALLYNLAFKLGRMVEEHRRDQSMRGEQWRI